MFGKGRYHTSKLLCLLISSGRSIVNEAAAASPKQPIVNMGQGFFGYNPPEFIINAAKLALDRVDCNQYSPTRGRPRLKKAIADSYSPLWGRKLDPETEVTITTGANEGWKMAVPCQASMLIIDRNAECLHGIH
jgi:aspartate/methionine/tyrosine aminotransferase